MSLDGKTVIVTGAAGGIGRCMVQGLLDAGANVFAVDREGEALRALPDSQRLAHMPLDLTDADSGERAVQGAVRAFGAPYALVNNAGIGRSHFWQRTDRSANFWEVDFATWHRFFAINADAVFKLTRAVVPHLLAARSGRIVTVTTSLESMLNAGMTPYGPAKAAAEAFTANVANDLAGSGITANVIIPGGATDTPMVLNRPGIPRAALLPPSVMVPPLLWLLGDAGAATTARRFLAWQWDTSLPGDQAAQKAGAPIAWTSLAAGSKRDARNPTT